MKRKRWLWLFALLPIVGLTAALRSAASWRPQKAVVSPDLSSIIRIRLSSDGESLLTIDTKGDCLCYDVASGKLLFPAHDSSGTFTGKFSSDGRRILFLDPARGDNVLRFDVWDARSGHRLFMLKCPVRWPHNISETAQDNLRDVEWSADGKHLMIAYNLGFHCVDAQTGQFISHTKWQFSPSELFQEVNDGRLAHGRNVFIGGAGEPSHVHVFDLSSGRMLRDVGIGDTGMFSPDGWAIWKWNESSNKPSRASCFRASDGKAVWSTSMVPVFSPDGSLAFVVNGTHLDVLDAHTGAKLRTLPGPLSDNFAPSPDGNFLYEARDGVIWKWRAR